MRSYTKDEGRNTDSLEAHTCHGSKRLPQLCVGQSLTTDQTAPFRAASFQRIHRIARNGRGVDPLFNSSEKTACTNSLVDASNS